MSAESPNTNRSRVTVSSTSGWDYVYGDSVDLSASDYSEIFDIDVAATGDVFVTGLFYGSFEGLDSGGSTRRFVQHRGSDGSISWTIDLDEAAAAHDCDAEPAEVYPGDSSTTFVDGSGNFYASSATLATVRHADLVACPTLQITPSGAVRTPDYASWPSLGLQCPCNGEDSFSPGSLGGALSIAPRPTGGVHHAQLQGTSLNVFALDGDLQLKVWSQPEISADFLGDDFALTVSRNDDLWLAATLNEPSPVLPDPLALIKMDSTGSFTKILNYDFEWASGLFASFRDDSIWISGMVSEYRDIMCPECEPMDKDSGGKYFGTWSLDARTGALIGRVSGTGDPSQLAYQGDWCVASTWRLGPFAYLSHESGLQINDACRSKVDLDAIDDELTNRLWWIPPWLTVSAEWHLLEDVDPPTVDTIPPGAVVRVGAGLANGASGERWTAVSRCGPGGSLYIDELPHYTYIYSPAKKCVFVFEVTGDAETTSWNLLSVTPIPDELSANAVAVTGDTILVGGGQDVTVTTAASTAGGLSRPALTVTTKTARIRPIADPAAGELSTLTPRRFMETRSNFYTYDSRAQGGGPVGAGRTLQLDVAGRSGVASDAAAVVLNVAAVNPQARGFLTVWPCGTPRPNASTLNFQQGVNIANAFTVPVGTNGKVCIYAHSATDLIVDVAGFHPAGSSYEPLTPARILETRVGPNYTTIDSQFEGDGSIASRGIIELDVAGRAGVAEDASAVMLNVAAVNPQARGFLTVWPCGTLQPNASTLNYTTGVTVANAFTVPVGTNGKVCIYAHSATDLIVDVAGYHPADSPYEPLTPARILETRIGPNYTTIDGRFQGTRTVPSRGVVELTVTGRGGVTSDASAVVLNVAAVSPQAKGFLTVWPCGTTRPNASTLNYTAGVTIANAFTVPVGTNGKVCIYAHSATDLIADVAGYQPVG